MKIASMIDHTLLKADATEEMIRNLCQEALKYEFAAVCINPYYVKLSKKLLENSKVKIATVVGFPLGANTKEVKAFEAHQAIENGADEVDMVINIGALKNKDYDLVRDDIRAVVESTKGLGIVKVIIETSLLNYEEKINACTLAKEGGADFVKTSTGFSSGGATLEDVALMKDTVGKDLKIKASGGIRDYKIAKDMIDAGASRIGASSSIEIAKGEN